MKIIYRGILLLIFLSALSVGGKGACPPPGTYSVGPTGSYVSITAALTDLSSCGSIAGAYIFELQSTYVSSVETFPITIPNYSGASASNTITFRPAAGATGLKITSSSDYGTIKLNGAQYVFFDGRPGGTGTANELTIENTSITFASSTPTATVTTSTTVFNVSNATGFAIGMQLGVGPGNGIFVAGSTITNVVGNVITISAPPVVQVPAGATIVVGYTPSAVTFIGDASNNTVTYCNVKSASKNANSGTVFFSTGVTSGNDNNTISNCDIYDVPGTSTPLMSIYSYGSFANTTLYNSGNKILNNKIHDFHSATASPSGMMLRASSDWTIDGNSIYQTTARNYPTVAVQVNGINISNNYIGSNFTITNNYIGGTAPNAGGSALTLSGQVHFMGIGIYSSSTLTASTVQNNVIQNILYSTSGAAGVFFRPITLFLGNINCLNNTVGSTSVSNSIDMTASGNTFAANMIAAGIAGTGGTMSISNNNISGIKLSVGGTPSPQPVLRGVFIDQNINYTVSGNTFSDFTSNANNYIRIIHVTSLISGVSVLNNSISNISSTSTLTNAQIQAIYTQSNISAITIQGNVINGIYSSTSANFSGVLAGVFVTSTTGTNNLIKQNTISAIRCTNSSASSLIPCGIYTTSTAGGTVSKNKIFDITNLSLNGVIMGYNCQGGNWTVSNNMISLSNSTNTNSASLLGISDATSNSGSRYYHYNTVYISGNGQNDASALSSAAIVTNTGTPSADIKNNILYMARTKGSGSGNFYCIENLSGSTTNFSSNYNILNNVNSTVGLWGSTYVTNDKTFSLWQTIPPGADLNSYTNEYIPFSDAANGDLHINTADATLISNAYVSNIESRGASLSTNEDYDGETRPSSAASVRGGQFAPDIGADEVDLTYKTTNQWLGIDNVWTNTANWSLGVVPAASDNINLVSGLTNYPVINFADTVKNISIGSGASFSIASGGSLTINGAYTSSGTIINDGELILKGTSAQYFPGTNGSVSSMNDLTVDNNAGVHFNRAFNISGTLSSVSGNINIDNAFVTIVSDATKTARVGPVNGSFSYTGTGSFIVQRYVPAKRAWRLLAAPLNPGGGTHTISEAWQERNTGLDYSTPAGTAASISADTITAGYGTLITGGATVNGFDQSGNNNSSLKYFTSSAWLTPANTNNTSVNSQEGWMVFVRGDRKNYGQITNSSKTPTVTTLRPRGQLFTGTKTITSVTGGMTVIGNPYASALDFHTATKTPGLADKYYMWDPQLGGTYGVGGFVALTWNSSLNQYDRSVGTSTIDNRYIPSGAAILVDFGSGGTLTFNESDKASQKTTLAFRPSRSIHTNLISVEPDGNNFVSDGVLNLYDKSFSNAVDNEDAIKPVNFSETFSTKRDGKLLAIEKRKLTESLDTVFYNWGLMKLRNYQLEIVADSIITDWVKFSLEDNYKKTVTGNNNSDTIRYNFSLINDATSYQVNRFQLVLKYDPPLFDQFKVEQDADHIKLTWSVHNEWNVKGYDIEKSADGIHFILAGTVSAGNNPGSIQYVWMDQDKTPGHFHYRVRCRSLGEAVVKSSVQKITFMKFSPAIYVTPNPATGSKIFVQLNAMPEGAYSVSLINNLGQSVLNYTIHHAEGTATETIPGTTHLKKGVYTLKIITPVRTTIHQSFLFD